MYFLVTFYVNGRVCSLEGFFENEKAAARFAYAEYDGAYAALVTRLN